MHHRKADHGFGNESSVLAGFQATRVVAVFGRQIAARPLRPDSVAPAAGVDGSVAEELVYESRGDAGEHQRLTAAPTARHGLGVLRCGMRRPVLM